MNAYDSNGRLKYNPEYHDERGTKWCKEDERYICEMHKTTALLDLGMAVGRPQTSVSAKLLHLKKNGKYYEYRRTKH